MTARHDNPERIATAEDEAADWIVRLSGTTTSDEDITGWQRWLAQSDDNRQAYARVEEVWRLSGQIDELPWPTDVELLADTDVDTDIDTDISTGTGTGTGTGIGAGIGTSIGTGTDTDMGAGTGSGRVDVWHVPGLPPLDTGVTRWQRRKRRVRRIAAAVAAVSVLGITLYQFGPWENVDAPTQLAVFETAAAEHRDVLLADGSRVSLGGRSLISVSFTEARRNVVLERGEAYFDVAENPRRPFVVHAGSKSIRAVGTAFNVAKHDDQVTVTVTEGRVIVAEPETAIPVNQAAADTRSLVAGQEARYDASTTELPVKQVDTSVAIAWRDGMLKYMAEPLSAVVRDVNRYSAETVVVIDADVGRLSFTGTVFQNAIDDWLSSLEQAFPVEVDAQANGDIHIRAR